MFTAVRIDDCSAVSVFESVLTAALWVWACDAAADSTVEMSDEVVADWVPTLVERLAMLVEASVAVLVTLVTAPARPPLPGALRAASADDSWAMSLWRALSEVVRCVVLVLASVAVLVEAWVETAGTLMHEVSPVNV